MADLRALRVDKSLSASYTKRVELSIHFFARRQNSCNLLTFQHMASTIVLHRQQKAATMLTMSKPKKGRGRPATGRKGKPLNVWLDAALRDAIERCRKGNRRALREEVAIALEEYLLKQGLWPPPGSS